MTTTKRRKTLGADSTNAGDKPTIKSLATALRVLSRFISAQGPLGVGEFEQQLKLNKSQVSKILKTFREFGFLEQDPTTQKYSVGLNAFALGNTYVNLYPLARDALPVMRKLVDETGHSAVLSVMHGTNVIHLLAVEGRLFIDGRWRVGRYMPYHSTSSGKLLLAFGPPERVDMLLKTHGLPRITSNTITQERQFRSGTAEGAQNRDLGDTQRNLCGIRLNRCASAGCYGLCYRGARAHLSGAFADASGRTKATVRRYNAARVSFP